MSSLDALLDDLAERVAAKVLARLSSPSTHYTSNARGPHPPGKSRSWALRNLKRVPTAKKVGRDWVVSQEAYDAWATEQAGKSLDDLRHSPANDVSDLDALADQVLLGSGYRRARSR